MSEYVKAGMPGPVAHGVYDGPASVAWYVDMMRERVEKRLSELGREEQETRLKRIQAEKQELIVSGMKREVVPIAQVHDEYGRVVSSVRSRLLAMPGTLAPQVIACTNPIEAQKVMDDAVRAILNELGTANFIPAEPVAPSSESDVEQLGGPVPRSKRGVKRRSRTVGHVKG